MKIFAFYLPQFHEIEENNLWWGKGFTEWTNVKKALPLFKSHNQPRIPLNENYYRLDDIETLKWQADLMHKYSIDGLCFYHYWFNGKLLLEKPAELLLNNKDINMPFFFSWANEPWTRSWDGQNKDILINQDHGNQADWIKHFYYLLPFFKDERYIKHHGKPIFTLYRSKIFEDCENWIQCWRQLAKENGLEDIHFISSLTSFQNDERSLDFDAYLNFEPMNTLAHHMNVKLNVFKKFERSIRERLPVKYEISNVEKNSFNYDLVWKNILAKKFNDTTYAGAFIDWDNTPRKAMNGSTALDCSYQKFKIYFDELFRKAQEEKSPYIFINAWNEWAEGAYLEPDTKNEYKYLESIKSVIDAYQKES